MGKGNVDIRVIWSFDSLSFLLSLAVFGIAAVVYWAYAELLYSIWDSEAYGHPGVNMCLWDLFFGTWCIITIPIDLGV